MFRTRQAAEGQDPTAFVMTLKPNAESCEKYGGCPFRDKCNLSPREKLMPTTRRGDSMGTVDLLANMRKSAGLPAKPAPAVFAPEGVEASPFAGINPPEKDLPPPPLVVTPATVAEEIQRPKGRGRPPGSKNKAKVETVAELPEPEAVGRADLIALPAEPEAAAKAIEDFHANWAINAAGPKTTPYGGTNLINALRAAATAFLVATDDQ
jgi:hypothetical protein